MPRGRFTTGCRWACSGGFEGLTAGAAFTFARWVVPGRSACPTIRNFASSGRTRRTTSGALAINTIINGVGAGRRVLPLRFRASLRDDGRWQPFGNSSSANRTFLATTDVQSGGGQYAGSAGRRVHLIAARCVVRAECASRGRANFEDDRGQGRYRMIRIFGRSTC